MVSTFDNHCLIETQQDANHKNNQSKYSVEKKILVVSLKGLVAKTN
jgi:hypothetical protein